MLRLSWQLIPIHLLQDFRPDRRTSDFQFIIFMNGILSIAFQFSVYFPGNFPIYTYIYIYIYIHIWIESCSLDIRQLVGIINGRWIVISHLFRTSAYRFMIIREINETLHDTMFCKQNIVNGHVTGSNIISLYITCLVTCFQSIEVLLFFLHTLWYVLTRVRSLARCYRFKISCLFRHLLFVLCWGSPPSSHST